MTIDSDDDTTPVRSRLVRVAAFLGGMYLLCYLAYAGILAVLSSEGSVPPSWRDPEIPEGAEVVSVGEDCAVGGCWREIMIRPIGGQSVDDLAAEMGLTEPQTYGWRWYDPASVSVYAADPRGSGLLEVTVSYVHPLA